MTKEEARKAAEIMLAYANGEEIESLCFGKYLPCDIPTFNWIDGKGVENYRIKPKSKYRPFNTKEECWNEMHKHPDFGWIVSKEGLEFSHICDIFTSASKRLMITLGIDENNAFEADRYFNNFTFTDGTPFGVKEE